jgi:hypothetical protein
MKSFKLSKKSGVKEIDIRKELNDFMFGSSGEIAKGQSLVLRRMRTIVPGAYPSSVEEIQKCGCIKSDLESSRDYGCNNCDGEGYLFDEEMVTGYKTSRFEYQDVEKIQEWGKEVHSISFFYIEYHENISRYDKIIEPAVDTSGRLLSPLKAHMKYNVHMAERFRADKGRTEFWRLACWTD